MIEGYMQDRRIRSSLFESQILNICLFFKLFSIPLNIW